MFNDKRELIYTGRGSRYNRYHCIGVIWTKFKSMAIWLFNGIIVGGRIHITEDAYVEIFWITEGG